MYHMVEFMSLAPDAAEEGWQLLEKCTGQDSYDKAMARAQRFKSASTDGKIRILRVEIEDEFTF